MITIDGNRSILAVGDLHKVFFSAETSAAVTDTYAIAQRPVTFISRTVRC